ncbi:MAG TPA: hypothetical protein VLM40_06765, partial [Gemmata sp.]|nr:hypothetical protein [Gemmata sp.]
GVWVVEIRGYTDHQDGQRFLRDALVKNLQRTDAFAKDEKKIGKYLVDVHDPVKGRISHAFIYSYNWSVDNAPPNTFQFINESYLDKIIGGQSAGTPGMDMKGRYEGTIGGGGGTGGADPSGGGAAAAAPESLGPPWTGLGGPRGSAGPGSGLGGTMMGGGGPSPGMYGSGNYRPPGGTSAGGAAPPGLSDGSSGGSAPSGAASTGRRRWEFSLMLIWREPIPSGSGTQKDASDTTSGTNMYGGSGSGMGPPPNPGR